MPKILHSVKETHKKHVRLNPQRILLKALAWPCSEKTLKMNKDARKKRFLKSKA
jgi:hypothetical protein